MGRRLRPQKEEGEEGRLGGFKDRCWWVNLSYHPLSSSSSALDTVISAKISEQEEREFTLWLPPSSPSTLHSASGL